MTKPLKILIVRFSSIGDIVLTTPVVRCLKQQLDNVEIHYLTKPAFRSILEPNPYIDKVHVLQESFSDTASALKAEQFDHLIDLHHNLRTTRLKNALGIHSKSFYKMNKEKWLMVNFKRDRLKYVHIVDRYIDTVSFLGVKNDGKGLGYFIDTKDEVELSALPASHQNGYVGFVLGARHFTKIYPKEKVVEVINQLNYPVALLGGPEDKEAGDYILQNTGNNTYNACGQFSLGGSASLVRQAKAIITNDTGLMHIAAAFHKPIISIWGNTIPKFGMYPYYGDQPNRAIVIENSDLNCRPCSKIGYDKCPKGHFKCMLDLNVNEITTTTQQLLALPTE